MGVWLLQPIEDLLPEQRQEWLASYHLEAQFDSLLRDPAQSVVVLTTPGCGLTSSLSLLSEQPLLVFPYDMRRWPGRPNAFTEADTHFGQWMGNVAQNVIDRLRSRPETAQHLRAYQYEFLVWFVRTHLGLWQALSLLNFLEQQIPASHWESLRSSCERDDLRTLFSAKGSGILGQIGEALDIAAVLGWQGIYACAEITFGDWITLSLVERQTLEDDLRAMLSTLAPLTRTGFGIKLGLPQIMLEPRKARLLTRDRAKVLLSHWQDHDLRQLATRLLCALTEQDAARWEAPVAQLYAQTLDTITAIYQTPGPAAALTLASIIADAHQAGRAPPDMEHVRRELFARAARLRLDGDLASRCVWRGAERIQLTESLYNFFVMLWRHRGGYVNMDALIKQSSSKSNVDQTLTRLRKALEPSSREPIYLQRDGSGPRLAHERCEFPV